MVNVVRIDHTLLAGLVLACLGAGLCSERGRAVPSTGPDAVGRDTTVIGRRADSVLAAADSLREQRDVEAAMRRYEQALALYQRSGDRAGQANAKNEIGILYAFQDQRDRALSVLQEALQTYRDLGRRPEVAKSLNNVAILHKRGGDYESALRTYRNALRIFRELDKKRSVAVTLSNMGLVYEQRGAYDESLDMHEQALRAYRTLDDQAGIARSLDNIADIQVTQGQYRKARTNFREALRIHRELGNKRRVAGAHNGIGRVRFWQYEYDDALDHFRTAVQLHREIGDRSAVAGNLNDIGLVYQKKGMYGDAETVLQKALRIHRDIDDRYSTANTLHSLGEVERGRGREQEALRRYREAHRINQDLGNTAGVAKSLAGIGTVRLAQDRLAEADSILHRSVRLTEQLLRTASGDERRDFLAKEIDRFHALVTTRVRAGRPAAALRTLERSRARLLTERLSRDRSPDASAPSIPPIDTLQRTLGPNEAAVLYANTDTERPITAFAVTRESVTVREIPDSTMLRRIRRDYEAALGRLRLREELAMAPTQGTSLLRRAKGVEVGLGTEGTLANLVRLYRHDLSVEPTEATLSPERRRRLGQRIHDLLVQPLKEDLSGTDELVIVPDGALGYLPFETLTSWGGDRLIERWRVRYVQSLRTLHLLQDRAGPSTEPSPLLAIGGAEYDPSTYTATMSDGETNEGRPAGAGPGRTDRIKGRPVRDEEAREEGYRQLAQRDTPVDGYRRLGFGPDRWSNLPGTLREVQALGRIATGATLLVGSEAREQAVHRLSATGRLDDYRVLHFATHGFVVPERPDFSALVLSEVGQQTGRPEPREGPSIAAQADSGRADGYLNIREITALDLNAEFVALSACRTGLGRIYRGSGAVNFAQAFLRAGAGSAAVSLWAVHDHSTQRFMEAVYRRAWGRSTTWTEAIVQTKRAFLEGRHGERLRAPRFWAPFVYYGRRAGGSPG